MLGLKTYRKSFPALILRILHCVNSKKGLEDIILIAMVAVNCEQSNSATATTRTETTRRLTYSVSER